MRGLVGNRATYFRHGRGLFSLLAAVVLMLLAPAAQAARNSTAAFDEYQPPCSVYPNQPGCGGQHHSGQLGNGTGQGAHGQSVAPGGGTVGGGPGGGGPATAGAHGGGPKLAAAAGGRAQGAGEGSSAGQASGGTDLPLTGYPVTGIVLLLGGLLGAAILVRVGIAGAGRLGQARTEPPGGG